MRTHNIRPLSDVHTDRNIPDSRFLVPSGFFYGTGMCDPTGVGKDIIETMNSQDGLMLIQWVCVARIDNFCVYATNAMPLFCIHGYRVTPTNRTHFLKLNINVDRFEFSTMENVEINTYASTIAEAYDAVFKFYDDSDNYIEYNNETLQMLFGPSRSSEIRFDCPYGVWEAQGVSMQNGKTCTIFWHDLGVDSCNTRKNIDIKNPCAVRWHE